MVSVFYFTPLPGFFSPFPHGTCSLSVTREYLALRDGPRRFRQGFTCPALLRILLRVHNISFTGLSPTTVYLSRYFNYIMNFLLLMRSPTTPIRRLVWAVPLSLATTKGIDFSFYSSGFISYSYEFTVWYWHITISGFPHSEISGSKLLTAPRSISLFVTSFISF